VWEWAEEDGLKYPRLRGMANQSCTLPSALLSVITVVEEVGYADTLSIEFGPNPFAEYLRVACSEPLKAVELYAIGGQKVAGVVCSGNSEVTIQADALTPGIYVLNAVTLSGAAHTYKVTKK
ncbi:MAG: T9SS type A sorting domain-containing protein, partial [Muribaculaceae bacterium]|nr:T9SS type A sorting domain-containing protein [Muribaculaceae bacterium]